MQNPLINALLSFNRHVMLSFYLTHIKKETIINLLAVNVLILSLYLLYWLAEKSYNILLPPPRSFPVEQRRDLWIQVLHANGPSRTESRPGGYHPTHVGDPFEAGRCYAIRKLGGGSFRLFGLQLIKTNLEARCLLTKVIQRIAIRCFENRDGQIVA